jgi:hypothetical protein
MRPNFLRCAVLSLLTALTVATAASAKVEAAEPTLYGLPDATHAHSWAVSANGTAWFIPSRGTEWAGKSGSIIGSITPDGVVTEHEVNGFGDINRLAVGPAGEIWIAGYLGFYMDERILQIGVLSASGDLEQVYTVGKGGWIGSMAVADGSVWFVHRRRRPWNGSRPRGPSSGLISPEAAFRATSPPGSMMRSGSPKRAVRRLRAVVSRRTPLSAGSTRGERPSAIASPQKTTRSQSRPRPTERSGSAPHIGAEVVTRATR